MKIKAIILCLVLFTVTKQSQAQPDSTVQITLPAQHHAYIVAFMPSKSGVEDIKYMNQVANQITLDANGNIADTAQSITVTVSFDMVKRMYLAIGSQQERLAGFYNTEIKNELIPQIYSRATLLQDIVDQRNNSSSDTEQLIKLGFAYLKAIKQ